MPASRRRTGVRLCVLVLALAVGLGAVATTSARSGRRTRSGQPSAKGAQALPEGGALKIGKEGRGLVFKGLKRARRHEKCDGGYEIETRERPACTHGPDEAPEGVDVRRNPTVADLRAADTQTSRAALPCYGDGSSGPRVQAIYAHPADVGDRFAELVRFFPEWASRVDAVFDKSATETGGNRHVRWVTNDDCTLSVVSVALSATGDDSLTNTINELKAQGFNRSDRKYLVWADAGRYCGIGEILNDDRADTGNTNNYGPSFARVDAACWGRESSVEAHELMHTMGGIQNTAPHATGGWHCADENDRMCLADSSTVTLSYICPSEHENLFDCGHDDYFTTAPVPGSYLATHWNAANSSFLSADMPESCRITAGPTATSTSKHKKKHRHRRRAKAGDVPATCDPVTVFS